MRLEILSRFCFHKPDQAGIEKMRKIRHAVRDLADVIDCECPESREKATALTQLSFVMMSANSAIVQTFPIDMGDLRHHEIVAMPAPPPSSIL